MSVGTDLVRQKFDVLFGDELLCGVVVAGRKHNIPTVSQIIGPMFPTARTERPFLERSDLARENPSVGLFKFSPKQ